MVINKLKEKFKKNIDVNKVDQKINRKNIYDIINNSELNIEKEYLQLHEQFYSLKNVQTEKHPYYFTIYELVTINFLSFLPSVKKRSGTILKYNEYYNFDYKENLSNINLDKLVSFCEYLVTFSLQVGSNVANIISEVFLISVIDNAINCMDLFGYKKINKDKIYCFVEKKKDALAVAEIVSDDLSYTILEYNHYTMKGDLDRKKATLKKMSDDIEHQRGKLKIIDSKLTDQLYHLFNDFIRHNTEEKEYITKLSNVELEEIYDDIYQMWLLAKLELDNIARKKRISQFFKQADKYRQK